MESFLSPNRASSRLDDKFGGENIRQLGPEPIPPSGRLLTAVILPENHLGHINFLRPVDGHRNPLAVVEHADEICSGVNFYLQPVHGRVPLAVVGGIDQDLVEDFVEAGHVCNVPIYHFSPLENPEALLALDDGPDVGVGPEEDVVVLRALLIGLLDCFFEFGL
ncbi:tubulin/FtsZ family protein [Striga asiatica]|uniref:Tubulin/FtsZ family protein n=1 Tax=Striga asiatica TaxID=4170 RepID=A0A5A7NZZ2_STRAF|nr:tubulin/FtsZ family protein [Striga asiatica]